MHEQVVEECLALTVKGVEVSGRALKAAIRLLFRQLEKEHNKVYVGRNSLRRLTRKDGGVSTVDVGGRIQSCERVARKYRVRYRIKKERGSQPPTWTIFFKSNQADAIMAALKEYTRKEIKREERPSVLERLEQLKQKAQTRQQARQKEREGPEL